MLLYELLEYINDNSVITIWDANHNCICHYDGKDSIDEFYGDFEVMDIFPDTCCGGRIPCIGIEIDFDDMEE